MRAKIKILKIEERFASHFDRFVDGDRSKPLFNSVSIGWWVTFDSDPPVSICIGEQPLEPGETLTIEASL